MLTSLSRWWPARAVDIAGRWRGSVRPSTLAVAAVGALGWLGYVVLTLRILARDHDIAWQYDWRVYAAGAEDLLEQTLYTVQLVQPGFELPVDAYNQAPLSALVAVPFLGLGLHGGGVAWQIAGVVSLGAGALFAASVLRLSPAWVWAGAVVGLFATTWLFLVTLLLANLNLLMYGIVGALVWAFVRRHERSAGALLAIAAGLKFWPVVLLVVAARERRWQLSRWAVTGLAIQAVLFLAWLGPDALIGLVRSLGAEVQLLPQDLIGFSAIRYSLEWPTWTGLLLAIPLLAIPVTGRLGIGVAMVAGLTVIPHLWHHYLPILAFGLALPVADVWEQRVAPRYRPMAALGAWVRSILETQHWLYLAIGIFVLLAIDATARSYGRATPFFLVSLGLAAAALPLRRRPDLAALMLVVGGLVMRLGFWKDGATDQIAVAQAAAERVLAGGNPYGVGYAATWPPGAPFPYGPLGLMAWAPGVVVEFVAAGLLLGLLWWQRAWVTLAVAAGWHAMVHLTTVGSNDHLPGFLIALGLVLLRNRPRWGAGVLAIAAAVKPYAFAWFAPAVGFAGFGVMWVLLASTLVLWSPVLLLWGSGSYLASVRMAETLPHHIAGTNSLNMSELRIVAVPIALAGLLARRWEVAVLVGCAVFVVVMFFAEWASYGYWIAAAPPAGMAVESLLRRTDP